MKKSLKNIIAKIRKKNLAKIVLDASVANLSTIRLGKTVKYLIYPDCSRNLRRIIKTLNNAKIKYFIIGKCSNILISNYDGVLISLKYMPVYKSEYKNKIIVSSNSLSAMLASEYAKKNIITFLGLTMIPGTLGGAIVMNSSVGNHSVSDYLKWVSVIDEQGKIKKIHKKKCLFCYRKSRFLYEKSIILEASFIKKYSSDSIKKLNDIISARKNQPKGLSLGSVYKNGKNYYAGKLIEEAGLKGFNYKGIEISKEHSNIFLNKGGSIEGFIELMFIVELLVILKFNIRLQREIIVI